MFTPAVGAKLFTPALGFVSVPAERRDRSGMVIRVEIVKSGSGPAERRAGFPKSGGHSNLRHPCPSPEPPVGSQQKDSG